MRLLTMITLLLALTSCGLKGSLVIPEPGSDTGPDAEPTTTQSQAEPT